MIFMVGINHPHMVGSLMDGPHYFQVTTGKIIPFPLSQIKYLAVAGVALLRNQWQVSSVEGRNIDTMRLMVYTNGIYYGYIYDLMGY